MLHITEYEILLLLPILDKKEIVSGPRVFSLNVRGLCFLRQLASKSLNFCTFSVRFLMLITPEHWLQCDFLDHDLKNGLARANAL